jgi:hypothetical protein
MDLGFWRDRQPLQNIIITILYHEHMSTFHMAQALLTKAVFIQITLAHSPILF